MVYAEPGCFYDLILYSVVNAGAVFRQAFKGIAVIQSPDDDVLHRVHAEIVDVMLQNHGDPVLTDASRHVSKYRLCLFRAACIVAVHVPVEILEPCVLHRPGQQAHQPHVAVGADGRYSGK